MNNTPPPSDGIYILPTEDKIFEIDLNERTIITPTFLSVQDEHKAETIYFLVDRYYEYKDLAMVPCLIEYITAAGEPGIYPIPFYDILTYQSERKMIIPWRIEGNVTNTAGPVRFAIRFYELNENNKIIYNLRTKIATAQVLRGIDPTTVNIKQYDEEIGAMAEIYESKMNELFAFTVGLQEDLTLYWEE